MFLFWFLASWHLSGVQAGDAPFLDFWYCCKEWASPHATWSKFILLPSTHREQGFSLGCPHRAFVPESSMGWHGVGLFLCQLVAFQVTELNPDSNYIIHNTLHLCYIYVPLLLLLFTSSCYKLVFLNAWGQSPPPGVFDSVWRDFVIVATWRGQCYWLLVSRSQGCC